MEQINLTDFLDRKAGRSQELVASQLDMHQTAVAKMLRTGRNIILTIDPTGNIYDAYEIKRIGKFKETAAA